MLKNYNKQQLIKDISSKTFEKILGKCSIDYYLTGDEEFKNYFEEELNSHHLFNLLYDYTNSYSKIITKEFIEAISAEFAYLIRKQAKFNKVIKCNYEDSLFSETEKSYFQDALSSGGKIIRNILGFIGVKWDTKSYIDSAYILPNNYSKIAFNPKLKFCKLESKKLDITLILAESRIIKLLKIIAYYNNEIKNLDQQTDQLKNYIEKFLPESISVLNEYSKQICYKLSIDEIHKDISITLLRIIEITTYKAYLSKEEITNKEQDEDLLLISL